MRLLLILSLFFVAITADVGLSAETKSNVDQRSTKVILRKTGTPMGKHLKAPSRIFMECSYGENFIEFNLPDGVEALMFSISVHETSYVLHAGDVTVDNPLTVIPFFQSGEYDIHCLTDNGMEFAGQLVF